MSSNTEIPWKRIAAEAAAIVLSILLAFGIDAWWDERQDRNELHGMLLAVLEEFRASKTSIADAHRGTVAQRQSIEKLLDIAYGNSKHSDGTEVDGLLKDINWWLGHVPVVMTSLNAVVSSDHFTSINGDELRNNLASWSLDIEYLETTVASEVEFLTRDFWPYVRKNTSWAQIDAAHDRYPGSAESFYTDFPLSPPGGADHTVILKDTEFQNILFFGWEIKTDMVQALDEAENKVDTTIALLERELNE